MGILNFLREFWLITIQMAPWLLFGFFMAGLLSLFFSPAYIRRHLGAGGWKAVVKAALVGVPLPLCSCGVVPVTLAMRKQGAGKGAATSFLISTPQTGIDSFIVTWSMLGWVFAVFRIAAAFVTGIIGGLAVDRLDPEPAGAPSGSGSEPEAEPRPANRLLYLFHYGFVTLFDSIALALLIGLALAAVISLALPPQALGGYRGSEFITMLIMLAVGIPLYVCSTGSVPIAAALMMKGISPGAALVFLIVGPATNAATLAAMIQILGKRTTVIYLTTIVVMALACGGLLNLLAVQLPGQVTTAMTCEHAPALWQQAAAVILLVLLAVSLFRRVLRRFRRSAAPVPMPADGHRLAFRIEGLHCEHCCQSATAALQSVSGVTRAEVRLDGQAWVDYADAPPDRAALAEAIRQVGFELK